MRPPANGQDDEPGVMNLSYVEEVQERFLRHPRAVPPRWRRYVESLLESGALSPDWRRRPFHDGDGETVREPSGVRTDDAARLQARAERLFHSLRARGHLAATLDPLERSRPGAPDLRPAYHGITDDELQGSVLFEAGGRTKLTRIADAVKHLRRAYCGALSVECEHVDDVSVREWFRVRFEHRPDEGLELDQDDRRFVLERLTAAQVFEEFVQSKFPGAKSFSLEGAVSLVPCLDLAFEHAVRGGVEDVVIAMAHRGRLNILVNTLHKDPAVVFRELDGSHGAGDILGGDIAYHLGASADHTTRDGHRLRLSICFNPSHLESVDPVALGRVRAQQDRRQDTERARTLPVLVHGDAGIAGQGVVQETFNLSELDAYSVGGALHIVVDNQIGFTTPPGEGRTSRYASSIALVAQAPVLHVNGEHLDCVARSAFSVG